MGGNFLVDIVNIDVSSVPSNAVGLGVTRILYRPLGYVVKSATQTSSKKDMLEWHVVRVLG